MMMQVDSLAANDRLKISWFLTKAEEKSESFSRLPHRALLLRVARHTS